MKRQGLIFHCGFTISTVLFIIAVATGAETFVDLEEARAMGFRYVSTSFVARWSFVVYGVLNLPVVLVATATVAVIARLLDLPVLVAAVILPPVCVFLSAYWWYCLSHFRRR